ncbi:hypothetical protein EG346_23485 [Chryseobacterium carnipullorum]|uniref:Uncharacterized protein n=1 Tax=Chryseobacterium carnipullorum TaxID=1124835 RepID=A0A1M7KAI2_CHRCU|nr:hypothetical protein EG346_23485 [Chryseobacterium carnipullorum]AZA65819.1 hypothetical protein EG345_14590 [Chryseobacterium carnipullorum]SHM61983.1 hypothetical protein SAMN05444360_114160 [Chryseobacterium carnipullorum]STD03392.1 Uncharacterised protein [Chryseobacterium carnipullorum]
MPVKFYSVENQLTELILQKIYKTGCIKLLIFIFFSIVMPIRNRELIQSKYLMLPESTEDKNIFVNKL